MFTAPTAQMMHLSDEFDRWKRYILTQASNLFQPFGSKQNTLFDAIVATIARKYAAPDIFSFDEWYAKQGFTLIPQL